MSRSRQFLLTLCISFAALIVSMIVSPAALLNLLTPTFDLAIDRDVTFAAEQQLQLDVYRPRQFERSRAVIVFFYGGSWNSGSRGDYRFVAAALAARGFVVVVPDYRLYPRVRYPDFLDDCAAAVAWTLREAARFGGDPQRVFLVGHSAGAYNAAMLALDPRWLERRGTAPAVLKGWVGLAGPYDFLPSNNPRVQPVFMHPNYPSGAQPIEHVDATRLPAFIGAARSDDLVNPQRNSVQLAQVLRARGVAVTLKTYDRVDHITLIGAFAWPLRGLAPVLDDASSFLRQYAQEGNGDSAHASGS